MEFNKWHWRGIGGALAFGMSNLWLLSDGAMIAVLIAKKRLEFNRMVALIALPFFLTSFWAPSPLNGIMEAIRIFSVYSVLMLWFRSGRSGRVWYGMIPFFIVTSIFLTIQYPFDHYRATGIARHSTILGLQALVLTFTPFIFIAVILLGISVARSALAGFAIIGIFKMNWSMFWLGILAIFVFVIGAYAHDDTRIKIEGIIRTIDLRNEFIKKNVQLKQESKETKTLNLYGAEIKKSEVTYSENKGWIWYGYGYNGFSRSTNLIRPHNIYVLSWYEMGIFSVMLWTVILAGIVRYRLWWFLMPMILGFVVDDFYTHPEGIYLLGIMWLGIEYHKNRTYVLNGGRHPDLV